MADAVLEAALRRLVWHIHATSQPVELPAVIDATQPVLLVAPEEQGGAAVWAMVAEKADATRAVAECDQVFGEQAHPDRWAVRIRQFGGEQGWLPITAQHATHRRVRTDFYESSPIHGRRHLLLLALIAMRLAARYHNRSQPVFDRFRHAEKFGNQFAHFRRRNGIDH